MAIEDGRSFRILSPLLKPPVAADRARYNNQYTMLVAVELYAKQRCQRQPRYCDLFQRASPPLQMLELGESRSRTDQVDRLLKPGQERDRIVRAASATSAPGSGTGNSLKIPELAKSRHCRINTAFGQRHSRRHHIFRSQQDRPCPRQTRSTRIEARTDRPQHSARRASLAILHGRTLVSAEAAVLEMRGHRPLPYKPKTPRVIASGAQRRLVGRNSYATAAAARRRQIIIHLTQSHSFKYGTASHSIASNPSTLRTVPAARSPGERASTAEKPEIAIASRCGTPPRVGFGDKGRLAATFAERSSALKDLASTGPPGGDGHAFARGIHRIGQPARTRSKLYSRPKQMPAELARL